MSITLKAWAAIRQTDGREWIDSNSLSCDKQTAEANAEMLNNAIPTWAPANKVQRIVRVEIKEIDT